MLCCLVSLLLDEVKGVLLGKVFFCLRTLRQITSDTNDDIIQTL